MFICCVCSLTLNVTQEKVAEKKYVASFVLITQLNSFLSEFYFNFFTVLAGSYLLFTVPYLFCICIVTDYLSSQMPV